MSTSNTEDTDLRAPAHPVLEQIRGGLVVSCQAPPGDPLRGATFTSAMARSAVAAGALAVRVNGREDVERVREGLDVPVIGLWKDGTGPVYITPTASHAAAVARAGADIVAVDGTGRPRPDGKPLTDTIRAVHDCGRLVMADVATVQEGIRAEEAGADVISTTLSGYTEARPDAVAPDLELVTELSAVLGVPLVAEGRIRTPQQAGDALQRGAWAIVVGTAITAPGWITAQFVQGIRRATRAGSAT